MQLQKSVNFLVILLLLISFISQIHLINNNSTTSDTLMSDEVNTDPLQYGTSQANSARKATETYISEIYNDTRNNNIDFFQNPNQNQLSMNSIDNYKVADNSIYSNWKQGKSVSIDYQQSTSIPNQDIIQSHKVNPDTVSCRYSIIQTSTSFRFTESTYYIGYRTTCDTTVTSLDSEVDFNIPALTSGTLYYTLAVRTANTAGEQISSIISGSVSISDNEVTEYIINGMLYVVAIGGTTDWVVNIKGLTQTKFNYGQITGVTDPDVADIRIYQMYYVPNKIISQIRSEYMYTSTSTITHKLIIENWDYNSKITIYKPDDWDYMSISPEATINEVSSNIEITGTVPVTYEVLFSQQNNFFMAVQDVTNDLTECIDFECGNNFLVNRINSAGNNGIEMQTIVSDIVSQGSYALKLYDTAWGQTSFPTPYLEEGEYYFVYDIYIESGDGYYLWRGIPSRYLSDFEYGRWYTFVEFITVTDTFQYSTMPEKTFFSITLDPSSSPITLYIDNLHFLKASGKISTNSYSENDVTAQFVSVDNIEYPVYANEEVQLRVSERADDTELLKKTVITDENGIARYSMKSDFNQREYVIEAVSFESKFGSNPHVEHADSLAEWLPGGSGSMSQETVLTKDSLAVKYTLTSDSTYLNPSWNPYGTYDFTKIDYVSFRQYYSSAGSQYDYDVRIQTDGFNYFSKHITNEMLNKKWHHFILDIDDFSSVGSPDIASIDAIYFRFNLGSVSGDYSIYDKLYFIQAQKSYFTPVFTDKVVFSPNNKKDGSPNYVDFAENSADMDLWGYYPTAVKDGYWQRMYTGDYFYTYFPFKDNAYAFSETQVYDFTGYDYVEMRFYIDQVPNGLNSITMYWNWDRTDFWGNQAGTSMGTSKTGWQILRFAIHPTFKNNHANDLEQMRITVNSYGTNDFANVDFRIDYILPVKKDYDTDWKIDNGEGFSREFNEDETVSSFWASPATTQKGYASSFSSSVYGGLNSLSDVFDFSELLPNDVDLMEVKFRSTITGSYRLQWNLDSGANIVTFDYSTANEWQIVSREMSSVAGGTLSGSYPLQIIGNNLAGDKYIDIDYIRFIDTSTQKNLYETDNSFIFSSETDSLLYYYEIDGIGGYVTDLEYIQKDLTVGTHTLRYTIIYDYTNPNSLQTAGLWYSYTYTVYESDLATITIIDQSNNFLEPRQFKILIDGVRIYSDTFYWSDISSIKSIEILDLFDNQLYYSASVSHSRFIDIVLTMYSTKIINIQENPVHLTITRDAKTYSEWILPNEIVSFRLETATYDFTIEYSTLTGSFSAATTNGTTVNFNYVVSSDSALMISGTSIQDVLDNTISLVNDLDTSITAQLESQTNNITIQIDNTNSIVNTQTNNIIIDISNTNSTLNSQLNTIDTQITNLENSMDTQFNSLNVQITNNQNNITTQLNAISSNITNNQNSIDTQFNSITTLINNFESSMDSQLNSLDVNINNFESNVNAQFNNLDLQIYNNFTDMTTQINTVQTNIDNHDSSIDSQLNSINTLINNFESNMNTQFNSLNVEISNNQNNITTQINAISSEINNMNSSVSQQFNDLTSLINNFESSMDSQLNSLSAQVKNTQSNFTLQFNSLSSQVSNFEVNMTTQINSLNQTVLNVQTNTTLQINNLTSLINNFETSMDSQINSLDIHISNNLSNITLQFNEISSEINNMNSSVAQQFNDITVLLNNLNTRIDSQTNNLTIQISNSLTNITGQINNIDIAISNVNSEVINQANIINTNISNVNATLYLQSIDILNQISNNNSTIYNQTISILNAISNTNSTLYSQTLTILTQIDLSNSTQVSLLLTNQAEILEAQVIATEYMSELRIERSDLLPSGNYVSMAIQTNWRNATVKIYVNGTLQYDGLESDAIVLQLIGSGSFNITTVISNYTWINWLVISPTADTLVHYVLTNEAGVGLEPNIAKIVINGTTIYTLDQYYSSGTFLNITVYSWSNDLLYVTNATVAGSEQEIVLVIPVFGQEFRNDYNFDVLLELTSITNSNYTISKVIPANSSIIIEMFESIFNTKFSPITSAPINNGTHLITYSEYEQVVEFRKSLKAVRVDLSLSAISLTIEELTWFEKNVLPPMIAIFGVTSGVGLLVAIVLLAFRSFGINLFRENIIEKPVQKFGSETGFFTMTDDEDVSFGKKKRKIRYKNRYI